MTMTANNKLPFRLVVFDMAGTTVFDGDAVHHCLAAALKQFEFSFTRDEINSVMGIEKPVAIRTLVTSYGLPEETPTTELVESIHNVFLDKMTTFYKTDASVGEVEGAEDMFRLLHDNGIAVALDSGFSRPIIDVVLARLRWKESGLVDATVASNEVERGRPFPDMIYRAMTLTGIDDAKAVAKVGDTPSDLQEGASAGCGLIVGVTSGSHTRDELTLVPHTHLIHSVADLGSILGLGSKK
jgi:phosphonatase-like hydrolase